jgi:hypothetical protein
MRCNLGGGYSYCRFITVADVFLRKHASVSFPVVLSVLETSHVVVWNASLSPS